MALQYNNLGGTEYLNLLKTFIKLVESVEQDPYVVVPEIFISSEGNGKQRVLSKGAHATASR